MSHVRPYTAADLPALLTLFRDTVQTVNLGDYTQTQVDAWAASALDTDRWAALLRTRHTRVCADDDGHLLGFANLEPDGHLDHLFVHKDHQRRGIGTLLLEAIEAIARREAMPILRTEASLTARPFFEAHGFALLAEQTVWAGGMAFVNFRMEKEGARG